MRSFFLLNRIFHLEIGGKLQSENLVVFKIFGVVYKLLQLVV